jgi:surfeit locus 1 family protein
MSEFSQETGLHFNAVVLQTQAEADGLRRDWPEINAGVEKHWGYAFQWFAMAATQVLLYFWFQWIKPFRHATKQSS